MHQCFLCMKTLLHFLRDQVCGGASAVRHIFHRSIWNLRATSVLGDFTGFEAAELKVIVAK